MRAISWVNIPGQADHAHDRHDHHNDNNNQEIVERHLGTIKAGRLTPAGIARRMQPAAGMMPHRMLGMAGEIQWRMGRGVRPLAGLLGALDIALVDRRVKHALALLGTILAVHGLADFLALSC